MLITPKNVAIQQHMEARQGMTDHFNREMDKILTQNSHKDMYWILGKVRMEKRGKKDIARPFLQACDEKPGLS